MSTALHVLLKADPCLKGDVADDKAEPLVCLKLNQISVFKYSFRNSWLHGPAVLRPAVFFKYLPQWLHCSGKQGRVASGR